MSRRVLESRCFLVCVAIGVCASSPAASAALSFGVVTPNLKVRPTDTPAGSPSASLKAARNEFEPFQIVLTSSGGTTQGVSVSLAKPLAGPGGAQIPAKNVVLYRVAYHVVGTASNSEGAAGPWPDPLIPDVDTYVGEKRNAFPFDVPSGESRVVWVEILVPQSAAPGDYQGELAVSVGGSSVGTIPVTLHVGSFALPSTASLASAFGMGWSDPCIAHTGYDCCSATWSETAAPPLRALYLRAGLEHRFTISDTDFQPPFGASRAPYETHILPLVDGTAQTRLPGAKLTAVNLDGGNNDLAQWISYAKSKGFFDRLFYYPVDEPSSSSAWSTLVTAAQALHAVDPQARIIITSTIQEADAEGATSHVDIFVPVINYLDDKAGSSYSGDQTAKYTSWLAAKSNRLLWAYQSCMSHGCGSCGTPSTDSYWTGWPNRVIDSSAIQNRCFPWLAFQLGVTGELYFQTTHQLSTAWQDNGQCDFSGSGDGTIFYPGKPAVIGGTKDIPVESIRMKLIREGMEDYEYLTLVAATDPAKAKAIAQGLFPHTYSCVQPTTKLDSARDQLFALLDVPVSSDGGPADAGDGGGTSDAGLADGDGPAAGDAAAVEAGGEGGAELGGGCGCRAAATRSSPHALVLLLAGLVLAAVLRWRRRQQ